MRELGPGFRVRWVAGVPVLQAEVLEVDGVRHAFSTRRYPQADDADILRALGFRPEAVVEAEQVHGGVVAQVDGVFPGRVPGADGLWTQRAGVVLRVRSADCLAVLLADPRGGRVGAVHAGWRGLARGILARAVRMLKEGGSRPEDLRCAVGPSVGPCCYEVDAPVRAALRDWPRAFREGRLGRWRLDLRAVGAAQLRSEGVRPEHLAVCAACTACEPGWFYSYRREGRTGHLWALVSREGGPWGR